jgi:hypothetical protein
MSFLLYRSGRAPQVSGRLLDGDGRASQVHPEVAYVNLTLTQVVVCSQPDDTHRGPGAPGDSDGALRGFDGKWGVIPYEVARSARRRTVGTR